MKLYNEFKQFVARGNVLDIAIGFIMGAAFKEISNSLVADIIMPPLGIILDNVNFTELMIQLKPAVLDEQGNILKPAVGIYYGKLIQSVLNFFIVAFAVFLIFKIAAYYKKKDPPAPAAAPVKSDEAIILEEIKNILKEQKNKES